MLERLRILQECRVQFADGGKLYSELQTNAVLRNEIDYLSTQILKRNVSGCINCYFDAYMELVSIKITKEFMEKIKKCLFWLLAGALLQDTVNWDNDLLCSNANITDDLALYHLKTNPNCRELFQELPENVDELIENFTLPGEKKAKTKVKKLM